MLVLNRKVGESFVLGENAEVLVKVLGTQGNNIRIGVQAPSEIQILRTELTMTEKLKRAQGGA